VEAGDQETRKERFWNPSFSWFSGFLLLLFLPRSTRKADFFNTLDAQRRLERAGHPCSFGVVKTRLLLALAVVAIAATAAEAPTVSDETLRAYKSLHKMTARPRSVATEFAALCDTPPAAGEAMKRTGPHYAHFIHAYMNDAAHARFAKGGNAAFPEGSIVVKEKLYANRQQNDNPPVLSAVAGMIKRAPGYAPKNGDWEFFYFEKDGAMQRNAALDAKCADCHRDARTDYVFGDFAKGKAIPATDAAR
jgi:hypothetical protein